ncbi:hypothetical protein N8D77_13525 [Curtobacterium flaccumfaciens]|uniref:hypothetical protein n=1 Tax=Curtobacterium flaccumfaciens TaxID=2035 RepID=UPI0021C723F7|nr:hypothetical protein [Curtobacterium flaccumfaciens]UXN21163.1 hypothetical protein N8D77_13525 [Curtobacterium flaccumfaciens pv. flaccumfaciens]
MGLIQLVERDDGLNNRVIQYRDNPEERPFTEFERDGFRAVLWGGPDLVTTAASLVEQGYRATNVSRTGTTMNSTTQSARRCSSPSTKRTRSAF